MVPEDESLDFEEDMPSSQQGTAAESTPGPAPPTPAAETKEALPESRDASLTSTSLPQEPAAEPASAPVQAPQEEPARDKPPFLTQSWRPHFRVGADALDDFNGLVEVVCSFVESTLPESHTPAFCKKLVENLVARDRPVAISTSFCVLFKAFWGAFLADTFCSISAVQDYGERASRLAEAVTSAVHDADPEFSVGATVVLCVSTMRIISTIAEQRVSEDDADLRGPLAKRARTSPQKRHTTQKGQRISPRLSEDDWDEDGEEDDEDDYEDDDWDDDDDINIDDDDDDISIDDDDVVEVVEDTPGRPKNRQKPAPPAKQPAPRNPAQKSVFDMFSSKGKKPAKTPPPKNGGSSRRPKGDFASAFG